MNDVGPAAKRIQQESAFLRDVVLEVERVIVGQKPLIEGLLIGLLADGHVLLEGVPGLAKSLAVQSLASALGGTFRRIQFTPDLLPSDLLGTHIYNPKTGDWTIREGPVFANFVLADEINRAPAKVQSALLEAMQERQVSLAGETRRLPEPFLVLATQNPIEHEGTYPLPEAQVDRFMLKLVVDYPNKTDEKAIIQRVGLVVERPSVRRVATPEQVVGARKLLESVYVDEKVLNYVVEIVFATRAPADAGLADLKPLILYGASPRAIDWNVTARMGRPYVKKYVEERELTVLFLLDLSASMTGGFGVWSARQTAVRFCACLALAAVRNNDKVGLIAFSEDVDRYIPAKKGVRHVLRIVRDCLALRGSSPRTNVASAIELAARIVRRRSVLFLISDFLDDGWQVPLEICARRHDVVAVRLSSPELQGFAPPGGRAGLARLRDPETGRATVVDWGSARVRKAWAERVARWQARTKADLRRFKVDIMDVRVPREPDNDAIVRPILDFFQMRELRGAKR